MKRVLITSLVACLAFGMTVVMVGCNTTRGMGQDVSVVGDGVSSAARRTGARPN